MALLRLVLRRVVFVALAPAARAVDFAGAAGSEVPGSAVSTAALLVATGASGSTSADVDGGIAAASLSAEVEVEAAGTTFPAAA